MRKTSRNLRPFGRDAERLSVVFLPRPLRWRDICTYISLFSPGYLYGQYKRINDHVAQRGRGVLWGGAMPYPEVRLVHFVWSMYAFESTL